MDPNQSERSGPAIVESYKDFEPPRDFKHSVETLLSYVPPKYLRGLKAVVLTNRAGLARNRRSQKVWSRNRKVRLTEAYGSYSRPQKSSPALVWLYVDKIDKAGARWWRWVPVLRYIVPGRVLYHEIGHHIHTVHRPIHEGREDVAEEWTTKLLANFMRKHYWYFSPLLMAVARIARPIAARVERIEKQSSSC